MKLHMNESNAKAVGMYDPRFEHDNCGIGAVVNIKGVKTHQTVENALKIVENLKHRAGKDVGYGPCVPELQFGNFGRSQLFGAFPCRTHRQRQEVEPMAVVDPVGMLYSNDSSELICIMYFLAPGFGLGRFFC